MRILVTGLGGPAGTNVVNFMPDGAVVAASDSDSSKKAELQRIGKADVKFFTVPPAINSDAFRHAISQIVISENIDVVIPTVDEELLVLSCRQEEINARIVVSPYETIRTCSDKALLYEKLSGQPFCPRYVVAENRQDLSRLGTGNVFMKPRRGRGSRGVRSFNGYTEIPEDKINKDNVFCENLPGQEYTTDCLFDFDGTPLVIVPRKRLEVKGGVSSRGETERHGEITENVKKLSGIFKFIGHVNIQFKADPSGMMKLVEINPRFSGGLPITAESGANTAELLYELLSGNRVKEPAWKEGVFENKILKR
jgi:carbamoyl-phosphate synthase large subunit